MKKNSAFSLGFRSVVLRRLKNYTDVSRIRILMISFPNNACNPTTSTLQLSLNIRMVLEAHVYCKQWLVKILWWKILPIIKIWFDYIGAPRINICIIYILMRFVHLHGIYIGQMRLTEQSCEHKKKSLLDKSWP